MSKSNYELQLNGLGYNADGTPMRKSTTHEYPNGTKVTTTVGKTPTYDELEERVDTFERKLIDEYGIPVDDAEKLITDDLLSIMDMIIDLKLREFIGDLFDRSVKTPGVEKGEF